jgi:imidazolonepropionase-like amidohydrolase
MRNGMQTTTGAPRAVGVTLRAAIAATLLAATGALAPAAAQTPAPQQSRPIALVGGTIHTVTNGVIENGTIVFDNGRITAIGQNVAVPANAERVDASGKHIYPGLIDAYNQMGLFEIGGIGVTIDLNETGDFNPNVRAQVAFNPETRHSGVARSNGVLVAVSTPGGGLISGHSAAMQLDGWTWEQMTLRPETGLVVNWPSSFQERQYEESIRRLSDYFATARAYRTAHQAAPDRHAFDARLHAMIPVLEGRTPVVVQANDVRQIQDAVAWAEREGLRMVLLGARDAGYVADLLAARNVPVLLTSVLTSPNRQWEPYDAQYSLPAQLHRAGVRVGITGGSSAGYANRLPYEAGAAIAYGLPADVALEAVTLRPAEFLGFADRVGSLEVGKDATLLITNGSPLEYATVVEQAFIEGRMIDMVDSHRRFFEKYSEKLRQMRPIVF